MQQQIAGIALFLVCEGKILLIHRDDKPWIFNPNTWALPGGGVDAGEDFFQAAARELQEELGIQFQLQILGISPKGNGFFFAEIDRELVDQIVLGEGTEYAFFPTHQLDRLELGGAIKIYWEKYQKILVQMVETGKMARGCQMDLFIWNGGKPK